MLNEHLKFSIIEKVLYSNSERTRKVDETLVKKYYVME